MSERDGEDMVRQALEDEMAGYEPSDWAGQGEELHNRVRSRKRLRGVLVVGLAASATAAAATVGVVLSGSGSGSSTSAQSAKSVRIGAAAGASTTPRPASPAPSVTPAPWAVRLVPSGKTVDFGRQLWMKLTAGERCVGVGPDSGGGSSCKSVTDGNQGEGTVSLQSMGDADGQMLSPLYIGTGQAVRMTVEQQGKVYPVHVVSLAGHPGYATGYVWTPSVPLDPKNPLKSVQVKITVYDARGQVLATFAPPS
jgi:hypothetical protein